MPPARDELRQILREDLLDFLIFFLFKKYLSGFHADHIPTITKAISNSWANRVLEQSNALNNTGVYALLQEVWGKSPKFSEQKKESDIVLKEEIENLCRLLSNIGADSQMDRRGMDMALARATKTNEEKNN